MTPEHPDKLCDQISTAVVGRYLHCDRLARVLVESAVSTGIGFISLRLAAEPLSM